MFSFVIGAKEDRYVETSDIPVDLLQIDETSGSAHLELNRIMAGLLARIDPDIYIKYIATYYKGHNIMYAECLKALYGTLDAALLFWVKLSTDLDRWGSKMN